MTDAIDYDIDRRLEAIAHRVHSINELDDAAQEARVDRLMARAARIGQQLDFTAKPNALRPRPLHCGRGGQQAEKWKEKSTR